MGNYSEAARAVPEEFRVGLRTQHGDAADDWLDALPKLLETVCGNWRLKIVDLVPRHGYLSVVWQVKRNGRSYALKLTIPSETFRLETAALLAWEGRAMVELVELDVEQGAALLQWLDPSVSLEDVPLVQAVEVAAEMLTVTPEIDRSAEAWFSHANSDIEQGRVTWASRNTTLGQPFSAAILHEAEAAVAAVTGRPVAERLTLANHDLHYANVIRDWDGRWTCVDPKPMIGPAEYSLAPLIWRRYSGADDAIQRVERLCSLAGLEPELAFDWLLARTVAYALWALEAGLTTDPANCLELVTQMTSGRSRR